jgi:hypothetical protein
MAGEAPVALPRHPVYPPVDLRRCPACGRENLPIVTDSAETQYRARCIECGFEGWFRPGTRSVSRVRRWVVLETRRWQTHRRRDDRELGLSRAEYGAEVGGSSGGG